MIIGQKMLPKLILSKTVYHQNCKNIFKTVSREKLSIVQLSKSSAEKLYVSEDSMSAYFPLVFLDDLMTATTFNGSF